ncbi:RING finger-containing protein [Cryptosporidium canis]|nr:RING finger-containing protein [Cryptosporidium canis]
MNYYIPELPRYPSYLNDGFSSSNNVKGKQHKENIGTGNRSKHHNSEALESSKSANLDFELNYSAIVGDINSGQSNTNGLEFDGFHNNISSGNNTYSLLPEWINLNYGPTHSKKSDSTKNHALTQDRGSSFCRGKHSGELTGNPQGEYCNSWSGSANNSNTNGNSYENGNNNGNSFIKRPRHFFCFSCNQFKPRSTKARFKVCKHVSCYHCLRKALHVEYWAAKNDIWEKCRAECPFCHISLDWTKMKPYIVLSIEAKQFPLMSLCDAEERQGEAIQVIHSFFPRGVPPHVIYGNMIDFSIQPKVTQILFGCYLELLNNRGSYEQYFKPEGENYSGLSPASKYLESGGPAFQQRDKLSSSSVSGSGLLNCGSSNDGSESQLTGSKSEANLQASTDIQHYSCAVSCASASTTITRASTETNTSTTATINTTAAPSISDTASNSIATTHALQGGLESEEEVITECETETESEGKKDTNGNNAGNAVWTRTYDIYPDLFGSWRRSVLCSLV